MRVATEGFTYREAENAAAMAAAITAHPAYGDWIGQHAETLEGWAGFIRLCLRLGPMIDRIIPAGAWGVMIEWYDAIDLIAEKIIATPDLEFADEREVELVVRNALQIAVLRAAIDPSAQACC